MATQLSPQNGAEPPSRTFGPCLLWPNGWMDQDATWYGGRPQPKRHCVRWGPSCSPPKGDGAPPQFPDDVLWSDGWMDGWIKMPLVMVVGLDPGHYVLDGGPAAPPQRGTAPNFRPISVVAEWLDGSRCHLVGR